MNKVTFASILLLSLPFVASAQDVQTFLTNFLLFINGYIIPFLIGIAFLFFVYNAIRFFVIGGSNEEGKEKAKALAIYGVAAFVLIIIFWGIVNLLSSSFGYDNCSQPIFDYWSRKVPGPTQPNCP